MATISAHSDAQGRCKVQVEDGGRTYHYTVTIPAELAERLGESPAAVAGATCAFLLDREPPTAIMREFTPDVVRSYFPEYDERLPDYLTP